MFDGRIIVNGLTKQFRRLRAVDQLSFSVEPGRVTGFLGPNGSGKTTTLRMLLGLVQPTSGAATIGGQRYDHLKDPLRAVGAVLEASAAHRGRTGRNHLRVLCAAAGLPYTRADQMLEMVDLSKAAKRRVKGYSLGMKQRLGIAAGLLGDPRVLILDEPANGLDPEGIRWMRGLLQHLASEGRTIFVSSHLLSEMQQLAEDVVIIGAGRLIFQGTVKGLTENLAVTRVRVLTPEPQKLYEAVQNAINQRIHAEQTSDGALLLAGVDPPTVGRAALAGGVELHELTLDRPDLEQVFLQMTKSTGAIR